MELPYDTDRQLCRLQVRVGEVCRPSTAECTQSGVCGRVQDLRRSTFEASVWERTGPGTARPLPKGMDSFHRASDERWRRTDAVTTSLERRGPGPRSGLDGPKMSRTLERFLGGLRISREKAWSAWLGRVFLEEKLILHGWGAYFSRESLGR